MEVKSVNFVFKPAQEILAELPIGEVTEPESDTRNICMSEKYKKEVKWVTHVFTLAQEISIRHHNEEFSELETHTRNINTSKN
jgi:hypothetical protein